MADIDANAQVSASDEAGRTLTGVGVSADTLEATIDAREPAPPAADKIAPAPTSPTAVTGEPPQLAKGRARYAELTHARDAEKARAEAAEKKAAELEARLAQPPPAAAAQTEPPAQSAQPAQTRAKPTEDDIGAKYATYADFVEDLSDWKTEQRMAALDVDQRIRQSLEADRAQQALATQVDATRAKGRAAYKDFDAVLSGPGAAATVQMPPQAQAFVWQQPNAEHLVYAILRDAELAQKLTWLSVNNPAAFGLELARLAPAQPTSAGNGHGNQAPPPAPMQPVGSGSRTTTATSAEYAEKGDYAAYKAARAAERKSGRG